LPSLTGDQEFPSIEERSLRAEWTILFPSNYPQAPPHTSIFLIVSSFYISAFH
jgi:hypothetical protein